MSTQEQTSRSADMDAYVNIMEEIKYRTDIYQSYHGGSNTEEKAGIAR